MAKNTKGNKNYLWLLGVVIIIIILGYYILPRNQITKVDNSATNSQELTRSYTSKLLKITIDVPVNYSVEEKFGTITLKEKNGKREIVLSRAGTNYNSLEGYLNDLNQKNNLIIKEKEKLVINNHEAVKEKIGEETYYSIYANSWVFSIKTEFKELFSDLDQIAHSFRYTP